MSDDPDLVHWREEATQLRVAVDVAISMLSLGRPSEARRYLIAVITEHPINAQKDITADGEPAPEWVQAIGALHHGQDEPERGARWVSPDDSNVAGPRLRINPDPMDVD